MCKMNYLLLLATFLNVGSFITNKQSVFVLGLLLSYVHCNINKAYEWREGRVRSLHSQVP